MSKSVSALAATQNIVCLAHQLTLVRTIGRACSRAQRQITQRRLIQAKMVQIRGQKSGFHAGDGCLEAREPPAPHLYVAGRRKFYPRNPARPEAWETNTGVALAKSNHRKVFNFGGDSVL